MRVTARLTRVAQHGAAGLMPSPAEI